MHIRIEDLGLGVSDICHGQARERAGEPVPARGARVANPENSDEEEAREFHRVVHGGGGIRESLIQTPTPRGGAQVGSPDRSSSGRRAPQVWRDRWGVDSMVGVQIIFFPEYRTSDQLFFHLFFRLG